MPILGFINNTLPLTPPNCLAKHALLMTNLRSFFSGMSWEKSVQKVTLNSFPALLCQIQMIMLQNVTVMLHVTELNKNANQSPNTCQFIINRSLFN